MEFDANRLDEDANRLLQNLIQNTSNSNQFGYQGLLKYLYGA